MHQCMYCHKVYTRRTNLNRHVRNVHQEENNKRKQTTNEHAAKIVRLDHTYYQQPLLNPYNYQLYYHPIYFHYPPTQSNTSQPDDSIQPNVSIQAPPQPNVSTQPNSITTR